MNLIMKKFKSKKFGKFLNRFSILIIPAILVGCGTGLLEDEKFIISTHLQSTPKDTVIVVHGSGGVTKHEISWAMELKTLGLNAVILDSYTRRGIASHTGKVRNDFGVDDRAREIIKLAEWISAQPWHKGKIGVIGFSQGGSTILAASSPERMKILNNIPIERLMRINFAIAYYPGCMLAPAAAEPAFPIQIHFAEDDDLAQPWRCYPKSLTNENYDLKFYKNARHTFDWARQDVYINGNHFSYNQEANKASRESVRIFIEKNLKK